MRARRNKPITTSHYMGAGAKPSVSSRKSNTPFSKIKAVYGDEMERLESSSKGISKRKLTPKEQQEIRLKVVTIISQEKQKKTLQYAITVIVMIVLIIITYYILF